MLLAIDHIQLAMPPEGEAAARRFYVNILGCVELEKPPILARRGGCWFQSGSVHVHLGVEEPFRPARKAHPAFVVASLTTLTDRLTEANISFAYNHDIPNVRRLYIHDPFGNRIELIEK